MYICFDFQHVWFSHRWRTHVYLVSRKSLACLCMNYFLNSDVDCMRIFSKQFAVKRLAAVFEGKFDYIYVRRVSALPVQMSMMASEFERVIRVSVTISPLVAGVNFRDTHSVMFPAGIVGAKLVRYNLAASLSSVLIIYTVHALFLRVSQSVDSFIGRAVLVCFFLLGLTSASIGALFSLHACVRECVHPHCAYCIQYTVCISPVTAVVWRVSTLSCPI